MAFRSPLAGRPALIPNSPMLRSASSCLGHIYVHPPERLRSGEADCRVIVLMTTRQTAHRPGPWPTFVVAGDKLLSQTLGGQLILAAASPEGYREYGRQRDPRRACKFQFFKRSRRNRRNRIGQRASHERRKLSVT